MLVEGNLKSVCCQKLSQVITKPMSGSGGDNMASSLTLTETASEICQEIEALFCWNPPHLQPVHGKKDLNSHLSTYAGSCDQALDTASKTLPPKIVCSWAAEQRALDPWDYPLVVDNEKSMTNYYNQFNVCIPVALTLNDTLCFTGPSQLVPHVMQL